jgi:hypothetical protein
MSRTLRPGSVLRRDGLVQSDKPAGAAARATRDLLSGSPQCSSVGLQDQPIRLESAWVLVMRWRSLRLKPKAATAPITGKGAGGAHPRHG